MSPDEVKCKYCGRVIENPDMAVIWEKGEKTFEFCSGACERAFKETGVTREEALR